MKKILIGLSLSLILSLLLVGCGVSSPEGKWIVDGKVYQYTNFFIDDATMLKDFHEKYGDEYEVVAYATDSDTIVCRKK